MSLVENIRSRLRRYCKENNIVVYELDVIQKKNNNVELIAGQFEYCYEEHLKENYNQVLRNIKTARRKYLSYSSKKYSGEMFFKVNNIKLLKPNKLGWRCYIYVFLHELGHYILHITGQEQSEELADIEGNKLWKRIMPLHIRFRYFFIEQILLFKKTRE